MIVCTCSFTDKGSLVEKKLSEFGSDFQILNKTQNQNLKQWVSSCFEKHLPLVFVGAVGIAVRTISPFVNDKLSDKVQYYDREKEQLRNALEPSEKEIERKAPKEKTQER